jgi:hypothetical protein
MPRVPLVVAVLCLLGSVSAAPMAARASSPPTPAPGFRAHVYFDQSDHPPLPGVTRGAPVQPLDHPADHFHRPTTSGMEMAPDAAGSNLPDPEVLGFVQEGEVLSGDWQPDIQLNLISTLAYDSIDVDSANCSSGCLVNDEGFQAYWSSQATSLFNAAHQNGDLVVATFTDFSTGDINALLNSSADQSAFIGSVVSQVTSRGVDGVNIDFEPVGDTGDAAAFTALMSRLHAALIAAAPGSSYLSVDVYASAYQGGEMYDIPGLAQAVDAVDVMTYSMNGPTQPNSPMGGPYAYTDPQVVNGFLSEMPADKLLLGIPYFGEVYSTTSTAFNAPLAPGEGSSWNVKSPYYSSILADFSCASQLHENRDTVSETPWAWWYSPASGDPCGADYGSDRELYYDNAQSLADKYALVNSDGLRGIGIWALGMDSGTDDLWNAIATSFSVVHGPAPVLATLPATSSTTAVNVCWSPAAATESALWASSDGGPWLEYTKTSSTCTTFYGWQAYTYDFYVQGFDSQGNSNGGPIAGSAGEATVSIAANATEDSPMMSIDSVSEGGQLNPASSPPLPTTGTWPGQDIVRGMATDGDGRGGQIVDLYGGLHPFGDAPYLAASAYYPGLDLARGVAVNSSGQGGYVLDAYGGLHPFGDAPWLPVSAYWPGQDLAVAVVLNSSGGGGYVLDAYGGLHPFGDAPWEPVTAYWPGQDLATALVLQPDGDSGWIVDAYGGMHPFGGAPGVSITAYYPGQSIVNGLVLAPDGTQGWTVDEEGGFHPFNGAPYVQAMANTPGQLTMRGASGGGA